MALQAASCSQSFASIEKKGRLFSASTKLDPFSDTYAPTSPRRSWHHTRPQVAPLQQGDQRARKDIAGTIINDVIFGFFASCGAALFRNLCGSCCR